MTLPKNLDVWVGWLGIISILLAVIDTFMSRPFSVALAILGAGLIPSLFGIIASIRVARGERTGYVWLSLLALLSILWPLYCYASKGQKPDPLSDVIFTLWSLILCYCAAQLFIGQGSGPVGDKDRE